MTRPERTGSSCARPDQEGTVLLVTSIVIIAVAGMSAVLMMRSQNNVIEFRQERREVQADYVADAAVSRGIAELNQNWLPNNTLVGSMSSASDKFVIHSGDDSHSPLRVAGAGVRGHPRHDGMDNDNDGVYVDDPSENDLVDEADDRVDDQGFYAGGIYRVHVREWVQKGSGHGEVGARNMDDDGDGQVDEPGEVSGFTSSNSRKFTMIVEASYGNYTIEKRVMTNAVQTSADKFGVYAKGDLTTFPNGLIDSYDSSDGNGYNNSFSDGNIAAEGDLTVKPGTLVKGDGRYMGNKNIKGRVQGQVKKLSSTQAQRTWELYRDFRDPDKTKTVGRNQREVIDQNYEKLTVDKGGTAVIRGGPDREIVLGDDYLATAPTAITASSGGGGKDATVKIQSQSQVFIQGSWLDGADTNIEIQGPPLSSSKTPTRIYISDTFSTNNRTSISINGRVEMNVVKEFSMGPKSEVNVADKKSPLFSLQVGGTWWKASDEDKAPSLRSSPLASSPGLEVTLKPKSEMVGVIHAPFVQNGVTLYPKNDFYGSLTGQNIDMKPKLDFHYDESIAQSCNLPSVICSWVVDNRNSWIVAQRGQGPVLD